MTNYDFYKTRFESLQEKLVREYNRMRSANPLLWLWPFRNPPKSREAQRILEEMKELLSEALNERRKQ